MNTQIASVPPVLIGFVGNTWYPCEFETANGWGASKAATVRTGSPVRPKRSDASGTCGCLLALKEGTIWESPVRWVN
jgi:hypothetical protein